MRRPLELADEAPLLWSPGRGTDVWAMIQAARSDDVAGLDRLLDADPDLARCHFEYRTPFHFAVLENRVDAAARLFDAHPPLHFDPLETAAERGYERMTAMLRTKLAAWGVSPGGEAVAEAVRKRDLGAVRELLDASPELVHAADRRTNRPIHWAVMTRQIDLIDELLDRGADIEAARYDGARPVQLANGDYHHRGWRDTPEDVGATARDVLDHLRSRGAPVDICTAAWIGDLERVRALLDGDPALANRPSDYVTYYPCSGTPLRNAAGAGHRRIVELLLEHGADPNLPEEHIAPRGHALHAAVCGGHREVVELLLKHGARPNVPVESSADTLFAARRMGDEAMVELLCSYGAASDLHLLAYYGDIRTAAAVLDADPGRADDPVALTHAAEEGHDAFVRLLLRHRPELATRVGVAARNPATTGLLFEHGMDPGHRDWLEVTPLHRLARKGDAENAALFVERGADLEAVDDEHRATPLGWAAGAGRAGVVRLLLERGADPDGPGEPRWARPLVRARRRGHDEVVAILEGAGANDT